MLDILTPRGQQTLVEEQRAIDIFHRNIDGINMVQTIKDRASIVDGFLLTNGVVRAVVENKGRDMSLAQLERFNWEWLVTLDKVIESRRMTTSLPCSTRRFAFSITMSATCTCRLACSSNVEAITSAVGQQAMKSVTSSGRSSISRMIILLSG